MPKPWKNLPFTRNTLICGGPGTGKTLLAVRLAIEDEDSLIVTCGDVGLKLERINDFLKDIGEPPKRWLSVDRPKDLLRDECRGGLWLIDEAQQYWPARGFKDTDPHDIKAVYEHRKKDGRLIETTQMMRNLDLIPAGFCQDVLRLADMRSGWGVSWFDKDAIKPPMYQSWSDPKEPVEMRTGKADPTNLLARILGVGTLISWEVVDPEQIVKGRTVGASADPELDPAILDTGSCHFNRKIADCYDSGQLVMEKDIKTRYGGNRKKIRAAAARPAAEAGPSGPAASAAPLPLPPF